MIRPSKTLTTHSSLLKAVWAHSARLDIEDCRSCRLAGFKRLMGFGNIAKRKTLADCDLQIFAKHLVRKSFGHGMTGCLIADMSKDGWTCQLQ